MLILLIVVAEVNTIVELIDGKVRSAAKKE